jgi:hypothetical protein
MPVASPKKPRPHIDALFLAEYRDHAATSLRAAATPGDEPDADCDGHALYRVAHRWEERKRAERGL